MQRLGQFSEGSGGIPSSGSGTEGSGADTQVGFWKVPVQMRRSGQVPEGCGADTQVRLRKVLVQRLGEGSGADT